MLKKGMKVLVKECQPDMVYNSIIYSDNHGNYKGVTGIVEKIIGAAGDKCILDFDSDMIFGEDMLDILEGGESIPDVDRMIPGKSLNIKKEPVINMVTLDDVTEIVKDNRDIVIEKLKEYREIIKGIDNPELYFNLYHDKLRSLLFEIYGG